jgi:hypothetical protein
MFGKELMKNFITSVDLWFDFCRGDGGIRTWSLGGA